MCIPGVQNFLGYKMVKWGTVPQNGVRLAPLIPINFLKKINDRDNTVFPLIFNVIA
jgi:hypothetical protein